MKMRPLLLLTLVALDLHANSRCLNPFPPRLYREAKMAFERAARESRVSWDLPDAVALHELILRGFDEKAAEKISNDIDMARAVNAKVGHYGLRAAHVAAMMQDTHALAWLKKKNADLSAPARRGFTPAHFAALGLDRECLDFIRRFNVTMVAPNEYGANPDQVFALTHVGALKPYFYCYVSGAVFAHDVEDFCMFTGAYFIAGIKQTPIKVIETWREEFAAREHPAARDLLDRVQNFRFFTSRLYLKSLLPIRFGVVFEREDFRLHANEDFAPGDVIEIYAGLFEPDKNSIAHGVFETKTDAVSGYLPFASDRGLTNMVFVQFFNRFGVSQGHFGMAIRSIRRHEVIVRERLSNEPVRPDERERCADDLDEILRNTTLKQMAESKNKGFDLVDIRNRALSKYLTDNTNVLLRLLAERKVSASDLKVFVASQTTRSLLSAFSIDMLEALFARNRHAARFLGLKAQEGYTHAVLRVVERFDLFLAAHTDIELERLWAQL